MRLLITTILLTLASLSYAGPREAFIDVQHDSHRGVTCWILSGTGISCLPDSQLRNTDSQAGEERHDADSLAGDQRQDGPTPARTPTPRQPMEAFQL